MCAPCSTKLQWKPWHILILSPPKEKRHFKAFRGQCKDTQKLFENYYWFGFRKMFASGPHWRNLLRSDSGEDTWGNRTEMRRMVETVWPNLCKLTWKSLSNLWVKCMCVRSGCIYFGTILLMPQPLPIQYLAVSRERQLYSKYSALYWCSETFQTRKWFIFGPLWELVI